MKTEATAPLLEITMPLSIPPISPCRSSLCDALRSRILTALRAVYWCLLHLNPTDLLLHSLSLLPPLPLLLSSTSSPHPLYRVPAHHPSSLNNRQVRHPINRRIHSLPRRFRGTSPPRITDTKPLIPRRNRQIRISQISLTLHLATNPLPDRQIKSLIIGIRLDAEGPRARDGGFGGAGEPVCWLGGCCCCGIPFGAIADHTVAVLGVGEEVEAEGA